jgi:hypothetical protein
VRHTSFCDRLILENDLWQQWERTASFRRRSNIDAGEEIVLARGKKPIARLVPFRSPTTKRRFGALHGVVSVGPAFFEPLPLLELAAWE